MEYEQAAAYHQAWSAAIDNSTRAQLPATPTVVDADGKLVAAETVWCVSPTNDVMWDGVNTNIVPISRAKYAANAIVYDQ